MWGMSSPQGNVRATREDRGKVLCLSGPLKFSIVNVANKIGEQDPPASMMGLEEIRVLWRIFWWFVFFTLPRVFEHSGLNKSLKVISLVSTFFFF